MLRAVARRTFPLSLAIGIAACSRAPTASTPPPFVCRLSSECPPTRPVCEAATGTCYECIEDASCTSGLAPVCDLATHRCVGCVSRTDCRDLAPPACYPEQHVCVQCLTENG